MKIHRVNQQLVFTPLNESGTPEIEMSISKFLKETKVDVAGKNPESSLIFTLTPGIAFNTLPFLSTSKQKAEICANLLDYLALRMEKYAAQIAKGEIPASVFTIASYCLNYLWGTYGHNESPWPSWYYASANRFCCGLVEISARAYSAMHSGQVVRDIIMLDSAFRPRKKKTNRPWYNYESNTAKQSAVRNKTYEIIYGDPLAWVKELGFFLIWLSKASIIKDIHPAKNNIKNTHSSKNTKTGN